MYVLNSNSSRGCGNVEKDTFTRKKPFIFQPFSTIFICGKIGKKVLITKWKKCGKNYIKVDKKIN